MYWVNDGDGTLRKVPKAGGTAVVLASGLSLGGLSIAVDATSVYVATAGRWGGSVVKVPIGGGNTVTLATLPATGATGIAVDDTSVYWTSGGDCTGSVMKLTPK